jgi:NAD-dependent deacetylase
MAARASGQGATKCGSYRYRPSARLRTGAYGHYPERGWSASGNGSLGRFNCFACQRIAMEWSSDPETPPRCKHCGGRLRPDVVWFGESLPEKTFSFARAAAETCDFLFSIGTSSLVCPAAELPERAHTARATVIQINPAPTPLRKIAAVNFYGKAGAFVTALLKQVWHIDIDTVNLS